MQNKPTLRVAKDIRNRLTLEKLKPKQRRFVIAYAGSGNMTEAIVAAGYSARHGYQIKNTAWRLLQIPEVRENLELLDLELESELIATSAECKARITSIMRDPKTEPQHVLSAAKMLLQANGDLDMKMFEGVGEHGASGFCFGAAFGC